MAGKDLIMTTNALISLILFAALVICLTWLWLWPDP